MRLPILVSVLAAAFLSGCAPDTPENRAKQADASREFTEEVAVTKLAEDAVKQCLKWPHDAAFNWFPTTTFNAERTAASVLGTVAAKNSFGASLTHDYGVTMVLENGGWLVDMIQVGNEVTYKRPQKTESTPSFTDHVKKKLIKTVPPKEKPIPEMRIWTDATGEHTIDAEFVSLTAGKVKLRKADGTITTLPLDKLSGDDQAWIKARGKR